MKVTSLTILFLTLIMVSCGVSGDRFKIEGRFLHLNQGEFYVYSNDGTIEGFDTIKIQGGRFAYDIPCYQEGTLIMVFPNFSEQPIFAKPGESVDIDGDASRLKEMKVTGTDENKLMNSFREQIVNASPPEIIKYAATFIQDHPESIVSKYLLRKYFIATPTPDYKKAAELIKVMLAQQPEDIGLEQLQKDITSLTRTTIGSPLPAFSATGINGEKVNQDLLKNAPIAVIYAWSTTNYESMDTQRMLKTKMKSSGGKLKVLGISLDPSKKATQEAMQRDSITWVNICDEMMFEGKTAKQLGIYSMPQTILLKKGKIINKGLNRQKLQEELDKLI